MLRLLCGHVSHKGGGIPPGILLLQRLRDRAMEGAPPGDAYHTRTELVSLHQGRLPCFSLRSFRLLILFAPLPTLGPGAPQVYFPGYDTGIHLGIPVLIFIWIPKISVTANQCAIS